MRPTEPTRPPRVLYVVYWGALEPLGRALVLPSVKRLSDLGAELTVVTFEKPADAADDGELDWQHIGLFAAGALLGAALGAGATLLFAPQSGAEARHNIARRGRHIRARTATAWDDLRHELIYATRRGRRKLSRRLNRALHDRRERRALRDGDAALG